MSCSESGFFETSLSRTRTLLRSSSLIRPGNPIKRNSFQTLFSNSDTDKSKPPSGPTLRHPQSVRSGGQVVKSNPSSSSSSRPAKSKATSKMKDVNRSATILRAVPKASTTPATPVFPPLDQEPVASPRLGTPTTGRTSPASSNQTYQSFAVMNPQAATHASRPRASSNSSVIFASGQYWNDIKVAAAPSDPKAIIGVYKHGHIQWQQPKQKNDLSPRSKKNRKPNIQVVIPNVHRNRPLPALPFFSHGHHVKSKSIDSVFGHEVSPPSTTYNQVRDSVVSPLNAQINRPARHFSLSRKYEVDHKPHISQSHSSDDSHGDDASSVYSQRSSMTSMEDNINPPQFPSINFRKSAFSPAGAGVFDDRAYERPKSEGTSQPETAPRMKTPELQHQRRYAPHPPIESDAVFQSTCPLRVPRPRMSSGRVPSNPNTRQKSLGSVPEKGVIEQAIIRTESKKPTEQVSPTLSQAEDDLEKQLCMGKSSVESDIESELDDHLTELTDSSCTYNLDDLLAANQFDIDTPMSPPALPRKSSKRLSDRQGPDFRLSRVPQGHIASQIKRNRSKGKELKITIPPVSKRVTEDFVLSPIPVPDQQVLRAITPEVAESVILAILRNLESLDDLFATAVLNRGFYRVFKRHELELMKAALCKMSPPAWEHREICYPGHDVEDPDLDIPRQEYTPTSYLQYYLRDLYIIAALKSLIKDKCESFLRPEMAVALVSNEELDCKRVDDALWRIWTFCKIFGSGKGREEDIVAQIDWLKGGELVHQKTCRGTIFTANSLDQSETLANAPECFALGNGDGLTAEQLYDMMELWNCLGVLLQPFEGRTIQAREYGIYDNTDVRGGDIDGEEAMLDEWYYYLLTLGLSPILDLATPCRQADASAFILASENGWMEWQPPAFGGSRRNFLKEAASRVYENKINIAYASGFNKALQRQINKERMQNYAHEIRRRKNSGERLPEIRMSQERPMSEWSDVMERLTGPRPPFPSSNIVSHIPSLRSEAPNSSLPHESIAELPSVAESSAPMARPRSPPRRTVAQPLLPSPPPSTVPSQYAPSRSSRSMSSFGDHPAFRSFSSSTPSMPSLDEHPAFLQQQRSAQRDPSPSIPRIEEHPAFRGSPQPRRSEEHPAFQQHPPHRHSEEHLPLHPLLLRSEEHPAVQQHPLRRRSEEHLAFQQQHPLHRPSAESLSYSQPPPSRRSNESHRSEEQPAFQQHPLQRNIYSSNVAENTADKAVYRIVEMGFTPDQARHALRVTDSGDGLRVDRAVEMLLRGG
ncbi:hypothetical protein GQ43DRAFT_420442 [Delitschia confertaspora ATCC 74209]|uniref:UBA domain-containing protein n=1 Tax=Delitschia confertaspora ATCC 74209 TaxID=1513339 RepID=A0A9P4MWW9_9PLEO|nr:hypothetical protein GQ43DRAFT_420442 [Delitschia confertaspora ATCC 74209]